MSWDRPWEPTPERKAQEREWERRRLEQLDLDLVDTAQDLVDLKDRADAEEQKVAHLERLLDRKRELLTEISRIQRARTEAEKETRAAERRLQFERRRFEIGQLAAGRVSGRPLSRRRRGPGEGDPVPRRRFLRIQANDETWKTFRLAALDLGVSSARYLGEIAEAEAHRLGWRAL